MKAEIRILLLLALLALIFYMFFYNRKVFERFENYESPTNAIPSQPYNYMPPRPEDSPENAPTQKTNSMPPMNSEIGAYESILESQPLSYSMIQE
jgi:hypothetical protein